MLLASGPLYGGGYAAEYAGLHSRTGYSHPAVPQRRREFGLIFVMHSGNVRGQYDWQYIVCRATDGQATNRINDVILGDWRVNALFIGLLYQFAKNGFSQGDYPPPAPVRREDRNHILRTGIRAIP